MGSIRIVEFLGRGGMGEVYAGYDEKLRRKVALKVLRGDARLDVEARGRFVHEAHMLSQLEHPHICRIYDLIEGQEEDFLVLEFVQGTSLRRALHLGLSRAQKSKVAEQVALALAAAHEKGIVHRDLKPDNVMLTPEGEVKVLDFGLSKSIAEPAASTIRVRAAGLETRTPAIDSAAASDNRTYAATEIGSVMGTLGYMSPEQARAEPATPASDMYSYGLLLQELFTGKPPFQWDPGSSAQERLLKVARGERPPFIDKDRDLVGLSNRLKSLAPAARLSALDVVERLRWIGDKPRRRRLRLLAALAATALTVATVVAVVQAVRARREAGRANREAETAEQVAKFLVGMFEVSAPEMARGRTITVREMLDQGSRRVEQELKDQPLVQARLLATMGRVYRELGLYDQSEPLLRKALSARERVVGRNSPEVAESLRALGSVLVKKGKYAEAELLLKQAVETHELTLGADSDEVNADLNELAALYYEQGKYGQVRSCLDRVLRVQEQRYGADSAELALTLSNLASISFEQGEYREAEALWRRTLLIDEKVLGADHPDVAADLNNLAADLTMQGRYREAESFYQRALQIRQKVLGQEHPEVALTLGNLASLLTKQGRFSEAVPLFKRVLAIDEHSLGPDHPGVGEDLNRLAHVLQSLGLNAEARPLFERALKIIETGLSPDHPDATSVLVNLAALDISDGRLIAARRHAERALRQAEKRVRDDPSDVRGAVVLAHVLVTRGTIEQGLGDSRTARESWTRAHDIVRPIAAQSSDTDALDTYARVLLFLGRVDEARPVVQTLRQKGWTNPDFLALCRKHGLLSEPSARESRP